MFSKIRGVPVYMFHDGIIIGKTGLKIKDLNHMQLILKKVLKKVDEEFFYYRTKESLLNQWIVINALAKFPILKRKINYISFNNKKSKARDVIFSILSFRRRLIWKIKKKPHLN